MIDTGVTIAGYRTERRLGSGGMGAVYEATQLSLGRVVALKVLAPAFGEDAVFRERFRREAMLQAALEHPNIVPVYEAGESPEGMFIAMKLVRGTDLRSLADEGIEPERALGLLAQVADALDAAHAAGLVHRDVKPQNILVEGSRAYLSDFGLTRGPGEHRTTQSGYLGSLDYTPPEQMRGETVGPAGDIYALTAVLARSPDRRRPLPARHGGGDPVRARERAAAAGERAPARAAGGARRRGRARAREAAGRPLPLGVRARRGRPARDRRDCERRRSPALLGDDLRSVAPPARPVRARDAGAQDPVAAARDRSGRRARPRCSRLRPRPALQARGERPDRRRPGPRLGPLRRKRVDERRRPSRQHPRARARRPRRSALRERGPSRNHRRRARPQGPGRRPPSARPRVRAAGQRGGATRPRRALHRV